MKINVNEMTDIIKSKLKNYSDALEVEEIGIALRIGDGIIEAYGLNNAKNGELVEFEDGSKGMVQNLEAHSVGIVLLENNEGIVSGSKVKRTQKIVSVPVGDGLLGRVVDPLANPIDGKGTIEYTNTRPVERIAPGVMDRKGVNEPLETGLKVLDYIVPIGKGQRELIIGDRQTGKTQVAIDTIINQKGKNVNCVYVAIGQKQSTVLSLVKKLDQAGALEYTTIVLAGAADLAALQYLAPYSGVAIAEEWMEQGKDVLIVYDDLSKHASAYRTLSLLLRRPPGREAYPGDVFYLHSRLLERAAKLSDERGGGSITALPIVETLAGDISAYIPTNVISITDGQIFLDADSFNSGQRPAINAGTSVSRVGSDAQFNIIKKLSGSIKLDLSQYKEMEAFSKFGSDLDDATKSILKRGQILMEVLKQNASSPLKLHQEALILYAAQNGHLNDIDTSNIKKFEEELYLWADTSKHPVVNKIELERKLDDETKELLEAAIIEFKSQFNQEV